MLIGLDIDGVIADSYPVWVEELNKYYGKEISVLDDYRIHVVFDVPWEEMNNFFVENTERLFSMPKPIKGAKESIEALLKEGHDIVYVTARTHEEEEVTLGWLKKHDIPHKDVIFTAFKSKVETVKSRGMDIFVEDFPGNAEDIAKSGVPVLLLNASYNQGDLPEGVKRCKNWDDILSEIRAMDR